MKVVLRCNKPACFEYYVLPDDSIFRRSEISSIIYREENSIRNALIEGVLILLILCLHHKVMHHIKLSIS